GAAGGVRDSVPLFGRQGHSVKIPVRTGLAGASGFSVQVKNGAGLASGVLASTDSFSISAGGFATRTAAVDGTFDDAAIDDARGLVYLSMPGSRRVQVLSLATMAFQQPLAFATPIRGLDLTPGGDTLLVTLPDAGSVAVVDLARPGSAPGEVAITAAGAGFHPVSVRVSATGRAMVMGVDPEGRQWKAVEMSTSGSGQRLRTDLSGGAFSEGAYRTPDRSRMLFVSDACTIRYDASSDQALCRGSRPAPGVWSSNESGSLLARGAHLLTGDLATVRFYTLPFVGSVSGLSPDGRFIYLTVPDGLLKVSASTGTIERKIPLPERVDGQILFTGRYLIALHGRTGTTTRVYAVDMQ
ncbi:MAG: hypothetical protein ICV87_14300, partial [Gemmatimonadetes bacterium]|nr:hypothetical protein [Gemmatimonadota bacterium]